MKDIILISFILAFLLILPLSSSLNYYSVPFYSYTTGNDVYCPTIQANEILTGNIESNLTIYGTFNGTNYDVIANYYSPHSNLIAYSERNFPSDIECASFGTQSTTNIGDNTETRGNVIDTASSSYFTLKSLHSITPTVSYITFNASSDNIDSSNHIMNTYFKGTSTYTTPFTQNNLDTITYETMNYTGDNYNECGKYYQANERSYNNGTLGYTAIRTETHHRMFIFNSSVGSFNYSYLITGKEGRCYIPDVWCGTEYGNYNRVGYYKLEPNPIWQNIGTGTSGTGNLGLEPNELYVFQISSSIGVNQGGCGVNPCTYHIREGEYINTTFDLNVYVPNWDCGEYGECINGTQFRICIDLDGVVSDKIEYRFCYVVPEESVYLGFEDYLTTNVWYNYWGFWCACDSETKQVLYPENWFVENANFKVLNKNNKTGKRFDFIKMTSETAYEGDKSLKMWNLPPQLRIPNFETFIGVEDTLITNWISPTNYSDNNSWIDSENSFSDGVNYSVGGSEGNVIYANYNIESEIPNHEQYFIRDLTVRLDTNIGASPDTLKYSCIQISLNDEWSGCKTITGLTVNEQSFLVNFNDFVIYYDVCVLDTLKVRLILDDGSGTIQLDWIPVKIETYNPSDITFAYQDVLCENLTVGVFPDIRKNIHTDENNSIFLERNITLPTPYMSISFKVKKCVEPELKFYSTPICLDFNDHCYTHDENCNYESKGTITFYLKDAETGEFLYDIKSEVVYPNKWEMREYAIDSLQPNKIYTIGFAVIPENTVEPEYYCVYLDDVNIDIRNIPLVCVSECDNSNEIKRFCKKYDELGFCLVCEEIAVLNSPNCLISDSVIDKIESCKDWCGCEEYPIGDENYYTKYIGEIIEGCNTTLHGIDKCCEYSTIQNSDYCKEFCANWVSKGEGKLDEPLDIIADKFSELGVPEWTGKFFSPIMIIFYIILTIMAILTYITKSWQFGVITGLILMMVLGTLFIELLWIVILIIIVAGFILAKTIIPKQQ